MNENLPPLSSEDVLYTCIEKQNEKAREGFNPGLLRFLKPVSPTHILCGIAKL